METGTSVAADVDDATCAVHPGVPAAAACARCGAFSCADCLRYAGRRRVCGACIDRLVAEVPPVGARGQLARLAMFAMAALNLVTFVGWTIVALGLAGPSFMRAQFALAVLSVGAYLAAGVLFLRWFQPALLRATRMVHPPFTAIGCWVVPFVNWARPFELTREMLGPASRSIRLVGVWQGLWILGTVVVQVAGLRNHPGGMALSSLLMAGAALAAAAVVEAVNASLGKAPSPESH